MKRLLTDYETEWTDVGGQRAAPLVS